MLLFVDRVLISMQRYAAEEAELKGRKY